jgi:hypothetical protein
LKKLAFLGGAAGLGMIALLHSPITQAADHLDAAALATQPMADINDVYAWMATGGEKINLAMTVSPFDDGTRAFGPSVQYVFHMSRYAAPMATDFPIQPADIVAAEQSKVICTFKTNTDGSCWVVDPTNKVLDYVTGDFSAATGKASVGGKLKVFAGRRSDPFFFNLAGFLTAQKKMEYACGGGTMPASCPGALDAIDDAAHCPSGLTVVQTGPVAQDLSEQQTGPTMADPTSTLGPCPSTMKDCFAGKNVMAIVVQLDKSMVATDTKKLLSIWGSTHAGQ